MMRDIEGKFLLAVERGDLETLKTLLNSNNNNHHHRLDINCCDPLARNALVIAIDNENLEMVRLLIEAGVVMGDALLYAIDENFVEAVELLLDYEESNLKTTHQHSWEQERENSSFSADMTPLILAAHRNNFEIIKMLLDRRISPLPDPHDPKCDCRACCTARSNDCLRHSRARINAYRALASPCLMALASQDPLLMAFEMSAKLEKLGEMEPEYKEDYLRLRAQCQKFATRLLDHTRTSKELEILLNYSDEFSDGHQDTQFSGDLGQLCCLNSLNCETSLMSQLSMGSSIGDTTSISEDPAVAHSSRKFLPPMGYHHVDLRATKKDSMLSLDSVTGRHESYESHMRLARLRLAIHCKQKTFCAHPNIQELLANMWYENLPGFRRKNPVAQIAQVICIGLMFPVYSMAYLLAPHTQLGRYIKRPFIKFICHSASYMTFLFVLILASQRVEAFYSWASVVNLFVQQQSQESSASAAASQLNVSKMFLYHQQQQLSGGQAVSGARSLDSLTKIFEQLPASSKRRGTLPSPIEVIILIWVLSLIWAEIKQLRSLGMNYYKSDMWNTLDSVASGFYMGTIILRCISYFQSDEHSTEVARERWDAYDPTLLSEGLFAAATIFSSLKLIYIFSLNPYLGPLQISLGRMIIDIVRFSWIFMLVLFSFACGMNQLLWYYADLERHQCMNITTYMLAQYYSSQQEISGMTGSGTGPKPHGVFSENATALDSDGSINSNSNNNINMTDDTLMEAAYSASFDDDSSKPPITMDDSCKVWRKFSNVFESTQTLFWATFGLVDLENFDLTGIRQYTRFWALLMFGCYCFINVVVVLNLLIAMMNHSYVKISKKSDIEWKFARTRLWMSYFDTGSTVPAPFNILPSIKSICNLAHLVWFSVCHLAHRSLMVCLMLPQTLNIRNKSSSSADDDGVQQQANNIKLQAPSCHRASDRRRLDTMKRRERRRIHSSLTASYRNVMRLLVRRYLVNEQRLLERKRELTEAKLNRWAKLNAFE